MTTQQMATFDISVSDSRYDVTTYMFWYCSTVACDGRGELTETPRATHVFAGPGAYTVSVTITDSGGYSTGASMKVTASQP